MLQQNYFFANKVLFYLKHMENVWMDGNYFAQQRILTLIKFLFVSIQYFLNYM